MGRVCSLFERTISNQMAAGRVRSLSERTISNWMAAVEEGLNGMSLRSSRREDGVS